MRTNPASGSGVFNARICLALLLCSVAVLLGVASSAVPSPRSGALSVKDLTLAEATLGEVTITEFSDFQCPYCKRVARVIEQVRQTYGKRVKVIFKQLPLSFHQYAFKAAQASVCAQEQGRLWEYHDRLFGSPDLSIDALERIAGEVGLKQTAFNQCMASESSRAAVEKDIAEANHLGVRGTPTFFINGTPLRGAISFAALKREIDDAMLGAPHAVARKVGQSNIWQALPQRGLSNTLALIQQAALTETANQQQAATTTADGVTLSPASINFGYQLVGTTGFRSSTETVTNSGAAPLVITDVSVSGRDRGDFPLSYNFTLPVTVAPGNSITINFTFHPALPWRPGTRSARLEISEGRASQYVPLSGIGATCLGPVPACSSGCPDSDGDGLNDAWEIAGGIDIDNDGVIDPTTGDVLLPGADPNRPDVYLHYDYTTGTDGHNHNPPAQALAMVTAAFAAHGVTLHIDPAHTNLCEHPGDPGCVTVGSGAYVTTLLKNPDGTYATQAACVGPNATTPHSLRAAFPYLRQINPAYHYMIFSHFSSCDSEQDCTLGCPPDNLEASECALVPQQPGFGAIGSAEILGDDAIVSLGRFTDAGRPIPLETWAGIIMHELGHNFGLLHGGRSCANYDPNYISVMNYWFTQHGIPVSATPGSIVPQACATDADCTSPAHCSTATNTCFRLDYSSLQLPTLNKSALDETIGLNAGQASTDITFYFGCGGACSLAAPTNGSPIDWDNDGDDTETSVSADINNDGITTDALPTQNDWAQSGGLFRNLTFSFQCTPGFGD